MFTFASLKNFTCLRAGNTDHQKYKMTAIQLNVEIYRTMSVIAEDEGLLKQALKYLKKLATKRQDETLMTKEEFFARVDRAKQGKAVAMLPNENLTEFLRRQGYDL